MNRTPYRRVTPPRSRHSGYEHEQYDSETGDTVSHAETLIMQCIICGIIMVFVLIASLTDIAPARGLQDGMRRVLSGPQTLDELIADVRQFGENWLETETSIAPDEFFPTTGFPDEMPEIGLEQTAFPYTYYENIDQNLPPAADDQVSNQTVPEPPVTPGLWD